MSYDAITAAAERKQAKLERREKNKLEWAEKNKLMKNKKPIGVSEVDDKRRMQEFKEMLLKPANGARIINKIINKALDDEDKDQAQMLKICADRFLPVSLFEEKDGSKGGITILIDKTCGGTVTLQDGGGVQIANSDSMGSPEIVEAEIVENGDNNG